jgi:hypothetical protein
MILIEKATLHLYLASNFDDFLFHRFGVAAMMNFVPVVVLLSATLATAGLHHLMFSKTSRARSDNLIQVTTNLRSDQSHGGP